MYNIVYVRAECIYNDSRATKEIMALCEAEYNVTVLAWDKNGVSEKECQKVFSQYSNLHFSFFDEFIKDNIGFKNIHKLIKWFFWVNKQLKGLDHIHLIHACDLDAAMGVLHFCKKSKTKFIYDIYDYYIDSHFIPAPIVCMVEKREIQTINLSAATIICTEERREQISKASPKRTIVIHNSPDVETMEYVPIIYDYIYCGVLCDERNIGDIFREYHNNTDLRVCIAGHGDYKQTAIDLMNIYPNFTYHGSVNYSKVLDLEHQSMCISAIYDPSVRNHRLCAPNKFYEALALGKPIIVCKGTGIDRIVANNNIGIVIDYNAKELYSAIRTLKANPQICDEMGKKARKLYEEKYRWSTMKERLMDLYDELK